MKWVKRIVLIMLITPFGLMLQVTLNAPKWYMYCWCALVGAAMALFIEEDK
jgi:hypothetical protein